jgi:hypothetical protein
LVLTTYSRKLTYHPENAAPAISTEITTPRGHLAIKRANGNTIVNAGSMKRGLEWKNQPLLVVRARNITTPP